MVLLVLLLGCILQICKASSGIKTGKAADFYVDSLPGLAPGTVIPEMHAGLMEVGTKMGLPETSLFFWHMRAAIDTHTTVIWLNGGPGCSSMDGNLLEFGPFHFKDGLLYNTENSWAEIANLLFVDQPFGTGYSDPADGVFLHSLEDTAKAFVEFIKGYTEVFPEIAQTQIILAGESFAGHYIPHIWHALQADAEAWDAIGGIQAVLLGNPWIDPPNQYLSTPEFAKNTGLVPSSTFDQLDSLREVCQRDMQDFFDAHKMMSFETKSCEDVVNFVIEKYHEQHNTCFNMYNYKLPSPYPSCGMEWPNGLDELKQWLSRDDTRKALHATVKKPGEEWGECNSKVHQGMKSGQSAKDFVADILAEVPLMLMVGDSDFVCNPIGQDRFVQNLEWNGHSGFTESSQLETTEYGTWRQERNLTVVHVTNASHMVPVDNLQLSQQLLASLAGIESYLVNKNASLPSGSVEAGKPEPNQDEINKAMYRAYGQASMVALVVVLVVCLLLFAIWWSRGQGQGLSGKGFMNALLHSSMRIKPRNKSNEYVPLHNMGRNRPRTARPDVIIEEDEEEDEEENAQTNTYV